VRPRRWLTMRINRTLALSCLLMALPVVAAAQAPPAPATPQAQTAPPAPPRTANCAPTQQPGHPNPNASEGTTTGQSSEPLGDKLSKSDGVLCPPSGVDPEMRAPAPDGGNTPVIPPPGSPGGDQSVRPK